MNPAGVSGPVDVQLNQTYAHRFARLFVRPLIGTWVRPNHITWLRILIGIGACALLALGTLRGDFWSGVLWIIACVLDRADGELARLGNLRSEWGRTLDFYSDLTLDSLWFLAAGIGARHGTLGLAAIWLGLLICIALLVCNGVSELFERLSGPGVKAYYGIEQFHPDDGLFLLPLFIWFEWQTFVLVAASIATAVMALIIVVRYLRLRSVQMLHS
jgi:archaetidylinositol phosphate synthase